ncbi:barstar family protein [Arthrobacter sp.]|uniref:barstar family protein n=1 Tax=Arthrobacter sp. TaxID=1667 RepID=UPI0035C6C9D5
MHTDLASALRFPAYYGANLDALNDCLSDVATRTYGWSESDTGLVCVLNGYDEFLVQNRATAQSILDIYARQAAYAALFGHRMMCLVKSSDRQIYIAPVGGTPVSWNHLELQ